MRSVALILAGHGSHISSNTAGIVWGYVDRLREWGVAEEITACFWKEPPFFHQVLDTVLADEIVVVPVFTAQGYFTNTVIPAEMNLGSAVTKKNGRIIRYARTLGEHPKLFDITRERVTDTLDVYDLDPRQVAVALIGHGTKRDSGSREATQEQANYLRNAQLVAEVVDAYLDDEPAIPSIYKNTQSAHVIAVPFFLAPGSHVTGDVPEALGIDQNQSPSPVHGREVYYTSPVGTSESICEVIVELARETGLMFECQPAPKSWSGFPKFGRQELVEAVVKGDICYFGELELATLEVAPIQNNAQPEIIDMPSKLRKRVRENPFRPLSTSKDLPSGWRVPIESPDTIHAVVETVYPGTVADWARHRQQVFATGSLANTIQRQTGIFRSLNKLSPPQIEDVVAMVCANCIRHPSWHDGAMPVQVIPCKEPCNIWLSKAKEMVDATG